MVLTEALAIMRAVRAGKRSYDNEADAAWVVIHLAALDGTLIPRAEADAAVGAVIEEAAKAMGDYHWNRYASREQGGQLSSPAVFTSHTHQKVQEIIRALRPDAMAALDRVRAEARKVMPLRWWTHDSATSLYVAGTPFGEYRINKAIVSGLFYVRFNMLNTGFDDYYPTLEAAQDAVEADYESRSRATLVPAQRG